MRRNCGAILNCMESSVSRTKSTVFFLVTIKQRQVIKCFRCLSGKSSTVLQHLFKAVLLSEKIPNFLLKFTAHHIFF